MDKLDAVILLLAAILAVEVVSMATGAPDWQGMRWKVEATQRPNLLYPSGKIIVADTFDSTTLRWDTASGAGGSVDLTTEYALRGEASCKLAAAANPLSYGSMYKTIGLPASKKIGLQFAWAHDGTGKIRLTVFFDRYDGTTVHGGAVRYRSETEKWYYYGTDSAYHEIPGSTQTFRRDGTYWHRTKLVLDFVTDKYFFLHSNDVSLDLTEYSLRTSDSSVDESIEMMIQCFTEDGSAVNAYVDNITVTEE